MRNKILIWLVAAVSIVLLAGCGIYTEAEKTSSSISREADNFNVLRRLTVVNTLTDKIELEIIGAFSLQNGGREKVDIICKTCKNDYKKHIIRLNKNTIYFIEDLGSAQESNYKYEVYYPEQIEIEPVKKEE